MADDSEVVQQVCPACGAIMSVADAEPLSTVVCPNCAETIRFRPTFDHFTVVETLGVGGMGSVYKAQDTRLDRFVALKLLRKELSADPTQAAQLEHEARVTAAVNHPNVVQVYSSGNAHDQIYLVMELVEHGSLDDLMVNDVRVSEKVVLETGIQVAKGLSAAHEKGLIHRDVKPANILFSDQTTAKIGDFGLAVVAGGSQAEGRREIWGTPYYVAPERLNNEPEDFRSDIFSLGATLFHAAAGRPPFEGETTSASELSQLKSTPPDLRAFAPEISRETARVVQRMLAPNPQERFDSYADLIRELEKAYRPFSPAGSPTRMRILVAVVVLALCGLGGAGFYAIKARRAAEAARQLAATNAAPPGKAAVLQARFDETRRQLIAGNYDAATTGFNRLAAEAGSWQPFLSWVRFHVGLTALLQNRPGPARDAFELVRRTGASSKSKEDADLSAFFSRTAEMLVAPGPVRAADVATADPKTVHAFAVLMFAAKDWQLREFDEASALLEKFAGSDVPAPFAWVNEYKPFARKFLADHHLYSEWNRAPQKFSSTAELRQAVEKLRAIERKVQTRGVLAEVLKADEQRLTSELAKLEKTEASKREQQRTAVASRETPEWNAALAAAQKEIPTYNFAAALNAITRAKITEPALKKTQADERKRLQRLLDWKSKLIADINASRFTSQVVVGPATYVGATKATDARITFTVPPYGNADIEWTKIPPQTLLAIATSLIQPNAPDAADRQWLSAVFADALKLPEARELADSAAKAKPEYREQLKLLSLTNQ